MAKCPKCLEETYRKISQMKPNQRMIKIIEEKNNSEKNKLKEKVVCNDNEE